MKIQSVNPATEEVNKEFETLTAKQAIDACKAARAASKDWREAGLEARINAIRRLADTIRSRRDEYARLMTLEMGKTLTGALKEADGCANNCDYVADNAVAWLADEPVKTEYDKSVIAFEPIGVVLAVMPWNYPFSQVIRGMVPALTLGNAVVLRHSNVVPMCSAAIEEAMKSSGVPDGVFTSVITDHATVGKMIRSRFVDGISFTGSIGSGTAVAKAAAGSAKRCVTELGGSNPFIVLDDVDVTTVARSAVEARVANNGESCSSSKRFIVMSGVYDGFVRAAKEATDALVVGDPMDPKTNVGPLANMEQLQKIDEQVKDALAKGAKLECGGSRIGEKGYFFKPTVLTDVKPNMRVMKEETFGPVMPIIKAKSESDAIKLANSTDYGLGGSVWTSAVSKSEGEALARRLEAGIVGVNRSSASDYRMPFGGAKKSGIGREFSRYGMLEFANIKSIIIK